MSAQLNALRQRRTPPLSNGLPADDDRLRACPALAHTIAAADRHVGTSADDSSAGRAIGPRGRRSWSHLALGRAWATGLAASGLLVFRIRTR